jgi:hypothetical protein
MGTKGRAPMGARNGRTRLSEQQVAEIRRLHSSGRSLRSLAREFCLSPGTMHALLHGRTWQPRSPRLFDLEAVS